MIDNTETFYDLSGIVILVTIIVMLIMVFIINVWRPFLAQRRFLKMEIARNDGEERKYWESELKAFYISHIPVIRNILIKK